MKGMKNLKKDRKLELKAEGGKRKNETRGRKPERNEEFTMKCMENVKGDLKPNKNGAPGSVPARGPWGGPEPPGR
jgi:hypothetical protein